MKKKFLSLILLTSMLYGMQAEQAYLYKDSRVMGKGGVSVALGKYSTSVFSNPAGLASLRKNDGYIIDLLNFNTTMTQNAYSFVNDVNEASESTEELLDLLDKYNGDNFHIGVNNYSSISKNTKYFTWSIGILAASDANVMAHSNGTSSGDYIETSSRLYGGVVLGVAKPFYTSYGRVDIGISSKYISQISYEGLVGVYDLVNSDKEYEDYIKEYEKKSSGIGVDVGLSYHPFANSYWNLILGMSVMNLGLELDNNYGHQPMSVNFGVAISPEVSFVKKLSFAIDYVDAFGANKYREYIKSANGNSITYIDYDAYDAKKNIRLGLGLGLIDSKNFSLDIDTGLYQSAYTAGILLEFLALRVNLATYQENVGINDATANPDRRYMFDLGLSW